jgi:hypothetical protein
MRKAVAIAVVASALALAPEAASGAASLIVAQSPPNPVAFGQDVTVTMTVTNTGPDAFEPGTALSLFLLRYESDVMAPSTYTAASAADGRPCTPMATKPPSRGRVVPQKPPAGTQLPPDAKVAVVLGGR